MTNLKLSSRMHIMIIVSAVVVAIGLAMGLIFQFVSDGYFNYSAEYSSYNSVVVNCAYMDEHKLDVKEVCDKAFKDAGVGYYAFTSGDVNNDGQSVAGSELVFKFTKGTNAEKVKAAAEAIDTALKAEGTSGLSNSSFHEVETTLGGARTLIYGSIALVTAIVFQFLYFVVRYSLTSAFSALLADVHNLAIFVSLLAITRAPIGSSAVAFAALTVVLTMIGCCFLFDKLRKGKKDEGFVKLSAAEQCDRVANESLMNIALSAVCVAAAAVVLFVLMSVSALSVNLVLTIAIPAILGAVASVYGTAFFVPSVHSRIKLIGDNFKASHSKKAKKS